VHFSYIPGRRFSDKNEQALQFVQEKVEENSSHASTLPFVGIRQQVLLLSISPLYAGK
jgi:hypothetical protein